MPPSRKPRRVLAANRSEHLVFDEEAVQRLFRYLDKLGHPAIPPGELSIVFMDEAEHSGLHDTYLADPEPTDVITFPGDPAMDFAGEICVSVDYAKQSAAERSLDFSSELTLYLIHGWLHLAGFDDKQDHDRQAMRKAEAETLEKLGNEHVLLEFSYRPE